MAKKNHLNDAKLLSPRRKSSKARSIKELVEEQLNHFSISPKSKSGKILSKIASNLYEAHANTSELWQHTLESLTKMDRSDRIAYFNAKRFLCFQLAKILDSLHTPMRKSYQSLVTQPSAQSAKGPYPIFDNITAIFCSTPVITRTATYLYACTEWIDDAFQGKELLHEIYSRLLNPTSVSLANHIVDLEAGPKASEYFAWNFNSGMAAIDATLSHLVGYEDIILSSRNVYGGTHQLLNDWFGKKSNLNVALHWFDGTTSAEFEKCLSACKRKYQSRLKKGRKIYVYVESPCNPHGYVLDVPGIANITHKNGYQLICDSTVGTPFLQSTLRREKASERPDYVIHSYTKDLIGSGTAIAGVVIGRQERMFLPKNEKVTITNSSGRKETISWDDTLFWNVYYIKGAFLDSDKAFDVIMGMRTLELRMLRKCISTIVLSQVLSRHPDIQVHCSAVTENENNQLAKEHLFLGLPAPLFTIDFEKAKGKPISTTCFKRFFDSLEPAFGLQVSLGQINSVVLCPALTSHSELSKKALSNAGISPTTIRIAVGDEDPRVLIAHLIKAAEATIDSEKPGFSKRFLSASTVDKIYTDVYLDVHRNFVNSQSGLATVMK